MPVKSARDFLKDLHDEVAHHPGVGHSLLGRMTQDPRAREDFRIFAGQHYCLVGTFTRYLELLLLKAPDSEAKVWIAKVLVDEYGERSRGEDHAKLYAQFMRATGIPADALESIPLHPAVTGFVSEHLRICAEEPFLVGLGAIGPGHEWAIPTMFELCIQGLRRAGMQDEEIEYFTCHTVQDQDHGAWLEEALAALATSEEAQAQVRHGCLLSLAAREQLWWGIADKINAARMKARHPGLASATDGSAANEWTLKEFRALQLLRVTLPPTSRDEAGREAAGIGSPA